MSETGLALIPAYNEAERIAPVIRVARDHVREVVVIDDGSIDETARIAREAGAKVIRKERNEGKGASIVVALEYFANSGADYAILLDADGQHDPAEIPRLIAAARETGAGMVVGSRMLDTREMPWSRRLANRFTSWVTSTLARQRIDDSQCGYRLLTRPVLADLKLSSKRFETETEMLIQAGRAGHAIVNLPIRTIYESGRVSHINPVIDTVRFFKLVGRYLL